MRPTRARWSAGFGGRVARLLRTARVLSAAFVCIGVSTVAQGQVDRRAFQPVEQGVADTGPLSVNRRVVPLDLRVPSGFDRVYKFGEGSASKFARRSGGITAVFPRSTYASSPDGTVAAIPPGTVFYVGQLPDSLFGGGVGGLGSRPVPRPLMLAETSAINMARAPVSRPAESRQENRAGPRADKPQESTVVFSVFDDERFRARRIEGLLDRAARAGADLRTGARIVPSAAAVAPADGSPSSQHRSDPKNP